MDVLHKLGFERKQWLNHMELWISLYMIVCNHMVRLCVLLRLDRLFDLVITLGRLVVKMLRSTSIKEISVLFRTSHVDDFLFLLRTHN